MLDAPRSIRLHIAIFGKRNAGKSSLINAITNQDLAVVSAVAGTTTDPVYKSMEISPLGPVTLIDTPGIDDVGTLGELRVQKSLQVLAKTDVVILTLAADSTPDEFDQQILDLARERKLAVIGVISKADYAAAAELAEWFRQREVAYCTVNSLLLVGIDELKQLIVKHSPSEFLPPTIVGDLLKPLDTVILVCPVDAGAPKSRLILPQVQVLRDVMDAGAIAIVVTVKELAPALANLQRPPRLVITDSQAFAEVAQMVPPEIELTSFSILFARYKGDINQFLAGIQAIDALRPGDKILIAEACTHYPSHEDIGRVKIPRWLEAKVGGKLEFTFAVGGEFKQDLSQYQLIVHCGGCMINRTAVLDRLAQCSNAQVPVVNYGMLIGHMTAVLDRVLQPLQAIGAIL